MKIYPLPFFYYYVCLHPVFNYWVIWFAAFGNSLYLSVTFCTDYTIALFEQEIRKKSALPLVNWSSLRMPCHRKSYLPLASFTKLLEYWEMFWSFYCSRISEMKSWPCTSSPCPAATARLTLIVNLGCVRIPWFVFLQTAYFPVWSEIYQAWINSSRPLQVTFMSLCSIWAIPELLLWGELKVWISQTKEDMVSCLHHPNWWPFFP